MLEDTQHGFRAGRSCLSQLIEHYDYILEELAKGHNVDVVYLDFAKAFDKVDHGILCHKLKELGISGKLGIWLNCFLNQRQQAVWANGALSELIRVLSSVPQGTVLGPVLFIILINDISDGILSRLATFADDTRITRGIEDRNDTVILQDDLHRVYEWQETNNMQFNESKFQLLQYGSDKQLKEETHYVGPEGQRITAKDCVRDLGILMTNDATFTDHIDKAVKAAKQKCGWILRTFATRESGS